MTTWQVLLNTADLPGSFRCCSEKHAQTQQEKTKAHAQCRANPNAVRPRRDADELGRHQHHHSRASINARRSVRLGRSVLAAEKICPIVVFVVREQELTSRSTNRGLGANVPGSPFEMSVQRDLYPIHQPLRHLVLPRICGHLG